MPDSKQTHRYSSLALRILAIAPACYIAILIFKYSVNVPQWDEWDLAIYFEKFAHHTLSLADLFQQNNEYRQFFPNLIFVGLSRLTNGDVRYDMLVSFLLACLISFNVYQLGKNTIKGGTRQGLWIYFAANLLIFSPVQYENWFQGQQLIYFAPVACLTTGLSFATSARLRLETRFLLCAVLSFVSTFSAANGILCFALLLPVLVWPSAKSDFSGRRWLVVGWLSALAFSACLYFYHYRKPPNNPPLTEIVVQWQRAPVYFLTLLGGPFGLRKLPIAFAVGLILFSLFGWCCWQMWRLRSDRSVAPGVIAWLALAIYSLGTAVLITVGRLGFGVEQALAPRYTTFVIYLPVALVYLLPIIRVTGEHSSGRFINKLADLPIARLTACVIIVASLPTYLYATRCVSGYRTKLLRDKACLLFINTMADPCAKELQLDIARLQVNASRFDRLGFLSPPLVRSSQMSDIAGKPQSDPGAYGSFEQLTEVGADRYQASGWATLPQRGESADAVILSLAYPDSSDSVFTFAILESQRHTPFNLLRGSTLDDGRWRQEFSLARPASGQVKVSAWAFDSLTGKAYRLAGIHYIAQSAVAAQR
ncbi:MAG TPA: hypothetical protein VLL54_17200 [Pyrinomonadaceae bacterium]|nr:hypothetical protein [Pyrinomonadaceae bacterium]